VNIGEIVRVKREALGWSQRDLAKQIGNKLTQPRIAQLENGTVSNITIQALRLLAEGLRCSVVDLLPEEDKLPKHH
jgi:transcriptional regulator with XRE-family HTH domain